jgi:hypothetical protein
MVLAGIRGCQQVADRYVHAGTDSNAGRRFQRTERIRLIRLGGRSNQFNMLGPPILRETQCACGARLKLKSRIGSPGPGMYERPARHALAVQ